MSRFSNLEFHEEFDDRQESQQVIKDESYYLGQALACFEAGQFEQALRFYAKVLEFNPQNAVAWTGQVRMLVELEEFREAKLWADKALERFPNEPELLAAKAVALGRLGDHQNAMAFSDASIEERGDTPYIWLARGDVLLARREKRADYCFERAISSAPQKWFFRWLASRIHSYHKKFSIALRMAQEALDLDTCRTAIWVQLGRCQVALGMVGQARMSFEQACQLSPGCREAERGFERLQKTGLWKQFTGQFRQWFGR